MALLIPDPGFPVEKVNIHSVIKNISRERDHKHTELLRILKDRYFFEKNPKPATTEELERELGHKPPDVCMTLSRVYAIRICYCLMQEKVKNDRRLYSKLAPSLLVSSKKMGKDEPPQDATMIPSKFFEAMALDLQEPGDLHMLSNTREIQSVRELLEQAVQVHDNDSIPDIADYELERGVVKTLHCSLQAVKEDPKKLEAKLQKFITESLHWIGDVKDYLV